MSSGTGLQLDKLEKYLADKEQEGLVDDIANLEGARVYVFSGTMDFLVNPKGNKQTIDFYEKYGAITDSKFDLAAGHTMPTTDYGAICLAAMPPYIGKCSFNGAQVSMTHLHPDTISNEIGEAKATNLYKISQQTGATVMGPDAYAYIPEACQSADAECSLHVVFHGCSQTLSGKAFIINFTRY